MDREESLFRRGRDFLASLRDECFNQLWDIPYEHVLELAPSTGAYPIAKSRRVVKRGIWSVSGHGMVWRAGEDVYLVAGATASSWLLPWETSVVSRAIGFDGDGHPYELGPAEMEQRLPAQ